MNGEFCNTPCAFLDYFVNEITDVDGTEIEEKGNKRFNTRYELSGYKKVRVLDLKGFKSVHELYDSRPYQVSEVSADQIPEY